MMKANIIYHHFRQDRSHFVPLLDHTTEELQVPYWSMTSQGTLCDAMSYSVCSCVCMIVERSLLSRYVYTQCIYGIVKHLGNSMHCVSDVYMI